MFDRLLMGAASFFTLGNEQRTQRWLNRNAFCARVIKNNLALSHVYTVEAIASALEATPSVNEKATGAQRADIILPIDDEDMAKIVTGSKNYQFCKAKIDPSVKRIWRYRKAPVSAITHVCHVSPAHTRKANNDPLPENSLGNKEIIERGQI